MRKTKALLSRFVLLLAGLGLLLPAPARASFEDVPVSARGIAMGNANAADVQDVQGMFLNPASLGGVNQYEAYLDYDKEMIGLSDGSSIGRQIIGVGVPFKFGTFALGVNQFSAASIYKENTMGLSFGRAVGKRTWIGLGMKNMSVSYAQDQYTAINPVFKAGSSKSGMGLDLGMIHQAKAGYRFALSIRDGNEPDMGIKYPNKVDRKIDLGWSVKAGDRLTLDPAFGVAGKDYRFKLGAEYNKKKSNVFFRGGVNVGARDYRNLALGFGYRAKHFQIDYAMNFPLSGVATTLGTQQIGITARWGRAKRKVARTEEEAEEEELNPDQNPTDVVAAKPAAMTENDAEKARNAIEDAKRDLMNGQFQAGLDKMRESDPTLVSPAEVEEAKQMAAKAAAVAPIYPSIRETDAKSRLLKQAVTAYIAGDGKRAVNSITYVWQLNPKDERVTRLRSIILKAFPLETFDLKLLPGVKLTEQKLQEALELIYQGKYTSAVEECKDVLDLDPRNVLAMVRMGSAFWAMGMRKNAREIWAQAEKLDPNNQVLKKFLNRRLEGGEQEQSSEQEKPSVTATPEVLSDFKTKMDYYERLKRSGADNATLAKVLEKMLKQYEGTGVDLTDVYQEYSRVRR